jgi:glycerophosphoryl diester phosphodiesterase
LTLDVKQGVPFEMVVDLVEKHNAVDYAVIITYTLEQAMSVYKLNPRLMLSVGIYTPDDLKRYKSSGIPLENLIAFTGTAEKERDLYELLHENGIYCILGTLGNLDKRAEARGDHIYPGFVKKGADILATDRPIEAAKAIERQIVIM